MPVRPVAAGFAPAVVLLAGCAAGDDPSVGAEGPGGVATGAGSPSAPAVRSSPADSTAPSASPAPSASAAPVRVIEVTYTGGKVSGVGSRVEVTLGERLLVRVTSDIADEVHIHGYDLKVDVPAGGTVELTLTADIPGGFEVELESLGKPLFQLRFA